ncbi:hypothetical protein CK203_106821 [Vitis vinifera]|uniref:Uncharacterized protein n=1 Tax=Vitis vinifera TaxID=29760 RepID=A0A438DLJ1_VITVI|nr:hypothetical protein CK203_106821 [Vitis vinifera]
MAQKKNDGWVDSLEKEVGDIREEMQRLSGMERIVTGLAQNVTVAAAQREDHAKWIPGVGETSGSWIATDETRRGGNGEWHGGWRLEMSVFMGENPDGWIFRAD